MCQNCVTHDHVFTVLDTPLNNYHVFILDFTWKFKVRFSTIIDIFIIFYWYSVLLIGNFISNMSPYEPYKLHSTESFVVHLIMVEPNLLGHHSATSAPNDSPSYLEVIYPTCSNNSSTCWVHGHAQVSLLKCGSHASKNLTTNRRPFVSKLQLPRIP